MPRAATQCARRGGGRGDGRGALGAARRGRRRRARLGGGAGHARAWAAPPPPPRRGAGRGELGAARRRMPTPPSPHPPSSPCVAPPASRPPRPHARPRAPRPSRRREGRRADHSRGTWGRRKGSALSARHRPKQSAARRGAGGHRCGQPLKHEMLPPRRQTVRVLGPGTWGCDRRDLGAAPGRVSPMDGYGYPTPGRASERKWGAEDKESPACRGWASFRTVYSEAFHS